MKIKKNNIVDPDSGEQLSKSEFKKRQKMKKKKEDEEKRKLIKKQKLQKMVITKKANLMKRN